MILRGNVREAASSLYAAKQRSLLALIGIVIGIGSVIAMISVGTIVKVAALKQFQELGTEILTIRKGYGGEEGGRRAVIRLPDARALAEELSSIVAVAPSIRSGGTFTYSGKKVGTGELLGVTRSFANLNKLPVASGRFISDLDFRRYFCVVGAEIARAMRQAGAERIVGESIRLEGRIYTIVGTLGSTTGWGMRQFDANRAAFVPITTAERTFDEREIRDVIARMRPDADHLAVASEVREYFRSKADGLAVEVESARRLIEQMQKQMRMFALLLGAIGSISLIVGGIGVMNVMLVSVTERRREIGIRRALGARSGDIQSQFLIESVILSLLGGLFGVALGIGGSYGICRFSDWTFMISPTAVALGVGVASAVGVVFGFWPARQAARLDPIAALRAD